MRRLLPAPWVTLRLIVLPLVFTCARTGLSTARIAPNQAITPSSLVTSFIKGFSRLRCDRPRLGGQHLRNVHQQLFRTPSRAGFAAHASPTTSNGILGAKRTLLPCGQGAVTLL